MNVKHQKNCETNVPSPSQTPERKSLKASIDRYKEIIGYEKGLAVGVGPMALGSGVITFEIKDGYHGIYCDICVKKGDPESNRVYVYVEYHQLLILKKVIDECVELMREIT